MAKNFVNYHILISHSPSCLNRDDMNMQKTAIFGGKRRVRISSQSLKRTMRTSEYYRTHLGASSIRTKRISFPEADCLQSVMIHALEGCFEESTIVMALELLSGKEINAEDVVKGDSVAPWAVGEMAWFCEKIESIEGPPDKVKKKLSKELKNDLAAFRQSLKSGLDIALSGRMATSGLMSEFGKIDGALAVAHAITTHAVESEIDWFTAVDDLQELGSGHLDTQEFSSGVFYRYASLNIAQLQENLGGAKRQDILDIAAHVLHLLATEVPSAKQQSFAAHNLADLALVSFSDQPISLANAFEAPVKSKGEGFLMPSVTALHDYWERIYLGYGLHDLCAEFILQDIDSPDDIKAKDKLSELEKWIRNNAEDRK